MSNRSDHHNSRRELLALPPVRKRPRTLLLRADCASTATAVACAHSTAVADNVCGDHAERDALIDPVKAAAVLRKTDEPTSTVLSQQEGAQEKDVFLDPRTKNRDLLNCAPSINKYLAPGGTAIYLPRPEWFPGDSKKQQPAPRTFGRDLDSALHMAIRQNATEAALALIQHSHTEYSNAKGITPLILAAQKGNITVLRALLRHGADPAVTSVNGTSALLQAAHFGHTDCLLVLLQCAGGRALTEIANNNGTTPLMRAAQEGHAEAVRLILLHHHHRNNSHNKNNNHSNHVNRQNAAHMTALMLASQRGHAEICQQLLKAHADVDLKTNQDSTALLLACKRGHVRVVEVLVTAGCELCIRDSRGRTAVNIVQRRSNNNNNNNANTTASTQQQQQQLLELLDPSVQIDRMQRAACAKRNLDMMRLWHLLQAGRASVIVDDVDGDDMGQRTVSIHSIPHILSAWQNSTSKQHQDHHHDHTTASALYFQRNVSTQTLVRTMTLPLPLVEAIAQFLPRPKLWNKRIAMLGRSRSFANPNTAAACALDLMDEVLEEGGFLEACDAAHVEPPGSTSHSWCDWKRRRGGCVRAAPTAGPREQRSNAGTDQVPPLVDRHSPTFLELRHRAAYLKILDRHHQQQLGRVLLAPPYRMSADTLSKLVTISDLAGVKCIHQSWVDPETLVWRNYVPELDKFLTTVELYEKYGEEIMDLDGSGGILFEDWNSGCPPGLSVAFSEAQARAQLEERQEIITALGNSWISSYAGYLAQHPDSNLNQAVRPAESQTMNDVDSSYCDSADEDEEVDDLQQMDDVDSDYDSADEDAEDDGSDTST